MVGDNSMSKKSDALIKFLESNSVMINSLLDDEEKKQFGGDVVDALVNQVKSNVHNEKLLSSTHGRYGNNSSSKKASREVLAFNAPSQESDMTFRS
jgi:Mg2+ and Co2+ transporter CorA